jgi:prepilin-type processing-associated H-X9-DG protein
VVIAIIAILAAILFPVFAQAKVSAKKTANLSNLRQIGMAIQMYSSDYEGYPLHSSPSGTSPRTRWTDAIYVYAKSENIFNGPLATHEMFSKTWAHNPQVHYGGYGYNYQYLGNSRSGASLPFSASDTAIEAPADTVAIADTMGVRLDSGKLGGGQYVVDPPLTSSRGSGKPSGFYGADPDCGSGAAGPGVWGCRAVPAEWETGRVTIAFADGHASSMPLNQMDDKNNDGIWDNGWFNGTGRADTL